MFYFRKKYSVQKNWRANIVKFLTLLLYKVVVSIKVEKTLKQRTKLSLKITIKIYYKLGYIRILKLKDFEIFF